MTRRVDADDIKVEASTEHVERDLLGLKTEREIVLKSCYDQLGLWATVKRFRKASHEKLPHLYVRN